MMSFTPIGTLNAGDENPGGTIRQGEGFGLSGFKVSHTHIEQAARTMGEAKWSLGQRAMSEVGGLHSHRQTSSFVIGKGTLRGTSFAQAGGPGSASPRTFYGGV